MCAEVIMSVLKSAFKGWEDYFWIVVGSILTAASINVFLVPYKIAPGGVTGLATVIHYLSNARFPVGMTMLALNIPLFMAGIKFIGKKFIILTLFSTFLLSFVIDLSEPYTSAFVERYFSRFEGLEAAPDLLLYSIFGGSLMGVGLGLVFKSGATTGGTDLAARILNHFIPRLTMGQAMFLIDASVVVFAAIVFNSFLLAMYATVTLYISSKVIDVLLEGINFAKALFIISDESQEIAQRIMKDLNRGVTALKGKGMYTGNDKQVLMCVVHRSEFAQLKEIVTEIDRKAFIVLSDIREVLGEGFKTHK
jgi:uncharacterized membrane-anchored protein YitT (DUF2179 family)